MDWELCELSGHLRGIGAGDYWIIEGAWVYLQKVEPTAAGPKVIELGSFYSVEPAKAAAEEDAGCE